MLSAYQEADLGGGYDVGLAVLTSKADHQAASAANPTPATRNLRWWPGSGDQDAVGVCPGDSFLFKQ